MIYFITNKQHKISLDDKEIIVKDCLSKEDVEFISGLDVIGFDLETNDLDPYLGDILLMIIGDNDRQYVIDVTSDYSGITEAEYALFCLDKNCKRCDKVILGANIKFDYKFIKVKYGYTFKKMYDVMIAEQRLVQGLKFEFGQKKTAFSSALDAIVERRIGFVPNAMDKKIREEFIGVNPKTFLFDNRHIHYAAGDIKYLFEIREKQKVKIEERLLKFLIYGIEFPLIGVLAEAELRGVNVDIDKWKSNIVYNKEKQYEYQCKLDEEFRSLRNRLSKEDSFFVTGGKWDRPRNKQVEFSQDTLFGDLFSEIEINGRDKKKKNNKNEAYINYSSTDTLVYIFGTLKQPLPTKQKVNIVPSFITKRLKNGNMKRKVDKSTWNFTTGEGAIESYLTENPNTSIANFVKLLIEYRGYTTRLNTFGQGFLDKFKNRVTGKFHTSYRQCHAANGRLQSGDKDAGWFNSQNLPAEKSYREAFIAREGYRMVTTDLSGAEAVIMIDKAKDEKFYDLAIVKDDAHSPLGTAVWRAIGNYRLSKDNDEGILVHGYSSEGYIGEFSKKQRWKSKENDTYFYKTASELANITISKKENKEIRTEFKNTTFASIYGCKAPKYAKMLNISVDEAKIGLKVMRNMIPKTFAMVENNVKFAQANGYIILNYRTNSRLWYPQILEAKKNNSEVEWSILAEVDGSARNATISGTQADMVKEMMVEIQKDIEANNWDAHLIFQVHDELVYEYHESLKDVFPAYKKAKMCEVANRYLSFIKMSAEQHDGLTWTK